MRNIYSDSSEYTVTGKFKSKVALKFRFRHRAASLTVSRPSVELIKSSNYTFRVCDHRATVSTTILVNKNWKGKITALSFDVKASFREIRIEKRSRVNSENIAFCACAKVLIYVKKQYYTTIWICNTKR